VSDVLSVLGVDLASRRWDNTGTALLTFTAGDEARWEAVEYDVIDWPAASLSPEAMADVIATFAIENGVQAVSLDGPQGWREPEAGHRPGVGRWCEYQVRTQGKTGTYGVTYPATQVGWICFCIEVFEHLTRSGRAGLVNVLDPEGIRDPSRRYYLVECFPTQTWRSSQLVPLPGKNSATPLDVEAWAATLWQRYGFPEGRPWDGSHDDLQAVVAALPAAALLGGPCIPAPLGKPGHQLSANGALPPHWVEGLIWDACPLEDRLTIPVERPRRRGVSVDAPHTFPSGKPDPTNPILIDDRADDSGPVERGVRLFEYLAACANREDPTGIGYAQFACFIHQAESFQKLAGRSYLPSDSGHVVSLAHQVTDAACGRMDLSRGLRTIAVGMDTFIWSNRPPYDRPQPAFRATPYSQEEWRCIFPDGERRLIGVRELASLREAPDTK
jgi:hypothetical protein